MGKQTQIAWCDHTFNPWIGCSKVHTGCQHCYAARDWDERFSRVRWGPDGTRSKTSTENWREPLRWNRAAANLPTQIVKPGSAPVDYMPIDRPRVFCASLADVFEAWTGSIRTHERDPDTGELNYLWWRSDIGCCTAGETTVPHVRDERLATMDDLRADLFRLIDETTNLDWLLLTKRPENIRRMWPRHIDAGDDARLWSVELGEQDSDRGSLPRHLRNVWLGTSVSNQATADTQIPALIACRDLAPVLFLSIEPILGPVDLDPYLADLDWVIVGGESGRDARPAHPQWIDHIRRQCEQADTPFFFKQWGEWWPIRGTGVPSLHDDDERKPWTWISLLGLQRRSGCEPDALMVRVGKKYAGRQLTDAHGEPREYLNVPTPER